MERKMNTKITFLGIYKTDYYLLTTNTPSSLHQLPTKCLNLVVTGLQ